MSSERERILALSPEELNREVAAFMGWTEIGSRYFEVATSQWVYKPIRGEQGTGIPPGWRSRNEVPEYASDYNAVRAMEEEIGRRGLTSAYLVELMNAIGLKDLGPLRKVLVYSFYAQGLWALFQASPEVRCRAALLACDPGTG